MFLISAILMMAGSASRMHMKESKVYLSLGEKKVFEYPLTLFLSLNLEVICVIRPEDRIHLLEYEGKVKIVYGGKTRQESVFNGLRAAEGEYVLIHDAARPFVSKKIIEECITAFKDNKACLVVAPCKDSLYCKVPFSSVARDQMVLAQTPQGGRTKDFLEVHFKAQEENYNSTDDISLLMRYKEPMIQLVESDDHNFKITTQLDYITAKEFVKYV